jgi:Putative neutral zinc metallopeptidase
VNPRTKKCSLSHSSSTTHRTPGTVCCLRKPVSPTVTQNWYCSAITQRPHAARRNRRQDHSTAPPTKRCIWTSAFSTSWPIAWVLPGSFGQAYVIAHELGHHVQKLLGIESKVQRLRLANPSQSNPLSVRLELQADCLAGVWGHSTEQRNLIDQSDINSGLDAVAAVGDDRIQKMARGYVSPETFTHGTSAERSEWFRRGLDSGDITACNTFSQ